MSLTADEVNKIAYLARLRIEDDAVMHYANDLSSILDLVAQMNAINTETVMPLAHPLEQMQRLREDSVTERDLREHFQRIAPQTEAGLYLVPKVID